MTQLEQFGVGLFIVGIYVAAVVAVVVVIENVPCVRRLADRVIHRMMGGR
jgi:hypothetical protein